MMSLKKVNSSISNFKIKMLLKTIIFIIIFLFLESFFGYLLTPPAKQNNFWPKIRWEDFYSQEKNIDLAFIGSSHAYRSFDPDIFDKKLNVNSFNLGSSSQNPIDSYFVVQELLKYHEPETIVLEVYWKVLSGENYNFKSAARIYDYLKPSFNKANMLLNTFKTDQYGEAIFNTVRYHKYATKFNLINKNVKNIFTKVPIEKSGIEYYKSKGFVYNNKVVSLDTLKNNNEFEEYKIPNWNKKRITYLKKIIELIKDEEISLLLVTAPIPPKSFEYISDYNFINKKIDNITQGYNVNYIDYNIINKKEQIFSNNHFKDDDHLNYSGVRIMNNHLSEKIKYDYFKK